MKIFRFLASIILLAVVLFLMQCVTSKQNGKTPLVYQYGDILDIAYTPDTASFCRGWFSDEGAWIGFTVPEKDKWINGFCGPFEFDSRKWLSKSLIKVAFATNKDEEFKMDSVNYFPGELYLKSSSPSGTIEQKLFFINKNTALLICSSDNGQPLILSGNIYGQNITYDISNNSCSMIYPSGDQLRITFQDKCKVEVSGDSYVTETNSGKEVYAVISFIHSQNGQLFNSEMVTDILNHPVQYHYKHHEIWDGYLNKVIRQDMPEEYNRIAVKAVMTLITNWRSRRGGLLHDGVIPSHAAGYFIGFWAWDSWKHAVALSYFAPQLAKDQVRAMFDYQLEDGMVIDCIYTDINENNARDSKPPLAGWAVYEIFKQTKDSAFVKEMYPQLLSYYRWWYEKRDYNKNGICEFGSVDGTLEAAAWESGMDNAIRFDNSSMLKSADDAWSFDQESVDLNAYLAYEYKLLKRLSIIAQQPFEETDRTEEIVNYFFDEERGFFFDRKISDGSFIREEGCEAYTPFWTGIASKDQMEKAIKIFEDTAKFSTYIPFPTVAADNPKFMPKGYWRGPIWLDQTYFGISGLRKYGYTEQADEYTRQVFDRLDGLKGTGAIHENYGTHTGERLKAPHFSWSSAHLLMLYWEYGKKTDKE